MRSSSAVSAFCGLVVGVDASYAAHGAESAFSSVVSVVDEVNGAESVPCASGSVESLGCLDGVDAAVSVSLVSRDGVYGAASRTLSVVLASSVIGASVTAARCVGGVSAPAWSVRAAWVAAKHISAKATGRVLEGCAGALGVAKRNARRVVEAVAARPAASPSRVRPAFSF